MFADDMFMKSRTLIDAETSYATGNSVNQNDKSYQRLPPYRFLALNRLNACSAPRAAPPGMPCAWAVSGKENSPATASIAPMFRMFCMVFFLLGGIFPSWMVSDSANSGTFVALESFRCANHIFVSP
jgi:hypothetical protein